MREVRNKRYAAVRILPVVLIRPGVSNPSPCIPPHISPTYPTLLEHLDYMVLIGIDTQVASYGKRLLDNLQRHHIGILQKCAGGRVSIRTATSNRSNPEFGFNYVT